MVRSAIQAGRAIGAPGAGIRKDPSIRILIRKRPLGVAKAREKKKSVIRGGEGGQLTFWAKGKLSKD